LVGVTVWAHWLTGNRSDAEDVAQEASLRAIRGFAGGSARAWVLSIVRNTAYSWLRPAAVVTVEDLEAVEGGARRARRPGRRHAGGSTDRQRPATWGWPLPKKLDYS
jgi:RNA polymerase sigma-70 factor (ECF subfamily)